MFRDLRPKHAGVALALRTTCTYGYSVCRPLLSCSSDGREFCLICLLFYCIPDSKFNLTDASSGDEQIITEKNRFLVHRWDLKQRFPDIGPIFSACLFILKTPLTSSPLVVDGLGLLTQEALPLKPCPLLVNEVPYARPLRPTPLVTQTRTPPTRLPRPPVSQSRTVVVGSNPTHTPTPIPRKEGGWRGPPRRPPARTRPAPATARFLGVQRSAFSASRSVTPTRAWRRSRVGTRDQ